MYPAADLEQLRKHEEETGMPADPHLDAFMQAQAMHGKKNSVNTEFLLHMLGLGVRFGLDPQVNQSDVLSSETAARTLISSPWPVSLHNEHGLLY